MSTRDHIIYSHPARADGFSYFYIAYRPGNSQLFLRYRRMDNGEAQSMQMSAGDMLKFLAGAIDDSNAQWPREVVETAFLTLRAQIDRWQRGSGVAGG